MGNGAEMGEIQRRGQNTILLSKRLQFPWGDAIVKHRNSFDTEWKRQEIRFAGTWMVGQRPQEDMGGWSLGGGEGAPETALSNLAGR